MRRVWMLVAAVAALGAGAAPLHAAHTPAPREGSVTSLSVVPSAGRAELVIAVSGDVDVEDFVLTGPDRIVVDVRGARLRMPAVRYDRVSRGGITNVRVAQYQEQVVRVVLDLDAARKYTIVRGHDEIRIAIETAETSFAAWHVRPPQVTAAGDVTARSAARPRAKTTALPQRRGSAVKLRPNAAPQPRITVTYQDADIRDVLAAFAAFSGRTIVVGKEVKGNITAEIRDQPWDVALAAILTSQALAASEDANGIIHVDSYTNILAKQAEEPLVTQIVPVNYARAGSMTPTIESLLSRDCSAPAGGSGGAAGGASCRVRGSVVADSTTNSLIVTDVESRLDDIIGYVRDLDVRTPQVAIKAKIILVNRTDIEDLGVTYDLGTQSQFFNKLVQRVDPTTFTPTDINGDGVPDTFGGGEPYDKNINIIDLGGNQLSAIANADQRVNSPALSLIFSTAIGKFDLTAFIDALQEVQLADVQAEPSIVTLDNRPARILSGEETPVRVIDAAAAGQGGAAGAAVPRATVEFKETGIILEVTPHITNNRQILMTLHAERSNLLEAASDLGYTFQKQTAENQLLVADGETAVIGGLTVTQVTVSKSGIPVLVDLPLIGRLFGRTFTRQEKRDLLILVTPHIIDEGEAVGAPGVQR